MGPQMEMWSPPGSVREHKVLSGDDLHGRTLIEVGLFETGKKFRFRCPSCGNEVVNDQRMEPACTGPSWTNDHPMQVMRLVAE